MILVLQNQFTSGEIEQIEINSLGALVRKVQPAVTTPGAIRLIQSKVYIASNDTAKYMLQCGLVRLSGNRAIHCLLKTVLNGT